MNACAKLHSMKIIYDSEVEYMEDNIYQNVFFYCILLELPLMMRRSSSVICYGCYSNTLVLLHLNSSSAAIVTIVI